MEVESTFEEVLSDYPHILAGLKKLKITTPTDLQFQMLELPATLKHLILMAPISSGKTLALLLHSFVKFTNE